MAATYETLIKIGAKFSGTGFRAAQTAIDKTERGLKGLGRTASVAQAKMAGVWKTAAGVAGGIGAVALVNKLAHAFVDLTSAAFRAGDEVLRTHENVTRLISVYRTGAGDAEKLEKRLYGVAEAMEQSKEKGQDAEVMVEMLGRLTKSMRMNRSSKTRVWRPIT
jgi:hypothetical protein